MKKLLAALCLCCLSGLALGQELVEKIEVAGNDRVTRETLLYYLSSREGSVYDEESLRRDFRLLWSTGFFADIKIESERGRSGRIVKITVEENPVVRSVNFRTGGRLKESDIVNKLKEKDAYIAPYSCLSPYRIQKVKGMIEALLVEKGLAGGEITTRVLKTGAHEVGLSFRVREGYRAKVGAVLFSGTLGLDRDALVGAMKNNKKHDLLSWVAAKDTFKSDKLEGDVASVKKRLQESGYMEAAVGEPSIVDITKRSIFLKKQVMKSITIPVAAGERYRVSEVAVEGNKLLSSRHLRDLIRLKAGEYYNAKFREKAVEKIVELYRDIGYIYAQVVPVESLDPARKRVGVTFNIQEEEPAYLHRLDFKGNTFTKDKVMRREFMLREGDRFSLALFKDSVLRLKQIGLVDVDKEPDIKPEGDDPSEVDVSVGVKELQRNNLQFSAGYSGYEGAFVEAGYSTVNLLGTAESLNLTFQYGSRVRQYAVGFTEPYAFDLPVSLGLSVFSRTIDYPGLFTQSSRGINTSLGFRVKGFVRADITYGFEYMTLEKSASTLAESTGVYNPYYYGSGYGYGHYFVGSLSTSLYSSTIDSSLMPTSGSLYLLGAKFEGGPLGGDVKLIKPRFEWSLYHRAIGGTVFGLHLAYEFLKPYGIGGVPFWERFYLGGEQSVRGYDYYTVGPQDSNGINTGGEKSLVFNSEFIVPMAGVLRAILFFDAGNAFSRHERVSLGNLYTSTGLEFRLFIPALRVPFRLIFAYNSRLPWGQTSHLGFRFAVGTTF